MSLKRGIPLILILLSSPFLNAFNKSMPQNGLSPQTAISYPENNGSGDDSYPEDIHDIFPSPLYQKLLAFRARSPIENGMLLWIKTPCKVEQVKLIGYFERWKQQEMIDLEKIDENLYVTVIEENDPLVPHKKYTLSFKGMDEQGKIQTLFGLSSLDENGNFIYTGQEIFASKERSQRRLNILQLKEQNKAKWVLAQEEALQTKVERLPGLLSSLMAKESWFSWALHCFKKWMPNIEEPFFYRLWDLWQNGEGELAQTLPILKALPRSGRKDELEHVFDTLRCAKFLFENDYPGFQAYRKNYKKKHPEDKRTFNPLSKQAFENYRQRVLSFDYEMPDLESFIYEVLLYHDWGKAVAQAEHDDMGVSLVAPVLQKLGYDTQKTKMILWLVKHHALMSLVGLSIVHPQSLEKALQEWETPEQRKKMLMLLAIIQWSDGAGSFGGVYLSDALLDMYRKLLQSEDRSYLEKDFSKQRILGLTQTKEMKRIFQYQKAEKVWELIESLKNDEKEKVKEFIGAPYVMLYGWDNFTVIDEPGMIVAWLRFLTEVYFKEKAQGNLIQTVGFKSSPNKNDPKGALRQKALQLFLQGRIPREKGLSVPSYGGKILIETVILDQAATSVLFDPPASSIRSSL